MKYDKKRNDFVAFVIQFDGVINKTDDDEMVFIFVINILFPYNIE